MYERIPHIFARTQKFLSKYFDKHYCLSLDVFWSDTYILLHFVCPDCVSATKLNKIENSLNPLFSKKSDWTSQLCYDWLELHSNLRHEWINQSIKFCKDLIMIHFWISFSTNFSSGASTTSQVNRSCSWLPGNLHLCIYICCTGLPGNTPSITIGTELIFVKKSATAGFDTKTFQRYLKEERHLKDI